MFMYHSVAYDSSCPSEGVVVCTLRVCTLHASPVQTGLIPGYLSQGVDDADGDGGALRVSRGSESSAMLSIHYT
jgi:hypothetical protein